MKQLPEKINHNEKTLFEWSDIQRIGANRRNRFETAKPLISMAIRRNSALRNRDFDIFSHGSYANDTYISKKNDIDICICERLGRRFDVTSFRSDFYARKELREQISVALSAAFSNIEQQHRFISLGSANSEFDIDVIVARRELGDDSGRIEVIFSKGDYSYYWPFQHKSRITEKDGKTNGQFRKMVRIFKNINTLIAREKTPQLKSILVESLLWNLSDELFRRNCLYATAISCATGIESMARSGSSITMKELAGRRNLITSNYPQINRRSGPELSAPDVLKWAMECLHILSRRIS